MDLFSPSFNAEKVLSDLRVLPTRSKNFESVDEFEQHLCHTNTALVAQLQRLEVRESAEKESSTGVSRQARLSQMCAQRGRNITEPIRQLSLSKTDQQGPMRRLKECVEQEHTVCIGLRGRNSVNSFIEAKIVAFDKHWNLLIRDGDENFKPPIRMKRRATKNMQITRPHQYCEESENKTKTIWRRHLPCSLIRGDNVILIFVSPRLSIKNFLQNDQKRIIDGPSIHVSDFTKPFRLLQDNTNM